MTLSLISDKPSFGLEINSGGKKFIRVKGFLG